MEWGFQSIYPEYLPIEESNTNKNTTIQVSRNTFTYEYDSLKVVRR